VPIKPGPRTNQRGVLLGAALAAVLLAACSPIATPTYFVPPTQDSAPLQEVGSQPQPSSTPAIEPAPSATEIPPSPTPECSDDLDYLQDLTIPDGTVLTPGQTIDKRWEVRNSGSCNWNQRYSLRLISGDAMGANASMPLYPARAGTDATLQVLFTAPQAPGTYECQWQAATPDGTLFGDAFYMQIVVGG
jgi:hypothetical protein